jgi:hypothetical protein
MSRDHRTKALTLGVLTCLLGLIAARSRAWKIHGAARLARTITLKEESASPEGTLYSMLDAARAGNTTRAFLENYTGEIKETLRQLAAEATEPAFAKYLSDSNAAIKGLAKRPGFALTTPATFRE